MTEPTATDSSTDSAALDADQYADDAQAATPDGFRYADHTDPQLLDLLASQGLTAEESLPLIATARTWAGEQRDRAHTLLNAATAGETQPEPDDAPASQA